LPAAFRRLGDRLRQDWRAVYGAALILWGVEALLFLLTRTGPLVSDMAAYWASGTADIRTHVLGTYFPPLYPLLTIPFHHWGGPAGLAAAQTGMAFLLVLGVAWYLRRAAGIATGAIFLAANALFPILLLYARFVLTDDWMVLALFGWVLLADLADRQGQDWLFAAGGVCLGVGAAIRPEPVAVGALAAVWLLLRRRPLPALYTVAPIAAESIGFGAYTRAVGGVVVGSQQGFWQTLWQGNNPRAFGFYVPLEPAQAAPAVYRHLFLTWLAGHPLRFVLLCLARAVEFWFSSPQFVQLLAVQTHVVPWPWVVLSGLATGASTLAFFWGVRRLYGEGRLAAATWALIAVAGNWWFCVPFLVGGRFREDALPFALAVVALAWGGLPKPWGGERGDAAAAARLVDGA
jgi:hypothetical protein